ncbi:glycosyltransferase [Devosia sp.]|uniref:glycosyltransferase n=1 Tax=Devosia sp. TaxID=1871048 RepID=UPI001AC94F57|nr:glycosyltransferase [Devosia sp.]MBN9309875.1 glycosyltransferase [Devosia sp.]
MRGKRIVFHVPSLRGGGAERVWVLMANELAARGHAVTLFVWNGEGPNARLRSDAVHLVDLGMPVSEGGRFGKPRTIRGLLRSIGLYRRLKPDAVFSAPEFANLVTALALALSFSRARFFPSFHAAANHRTDDLGSRLAGLLTAIVAARATKAIAVSAGVGRDLVAHGMPAGKVAVIHNPLPPISTQPPRTYPWQPALDAMGAGPVIVTAGRMTEVKDQSTLLKAFARLVATRPARLVIFGEGPLLEPLKAETRALGLADRVLFPGYVTDPAECYAAADLFVLSSITEGFGNVLIEAMAAGVPVVSTDAPHGPREILEDGRFGPLVPIGDAAALAEAMGKVLDAPLPPDVLKARAAAFELPVVGDAYEALLG